MLVTGALLFEFLGTFIDYDVEPCVAERGSKALIGFALSLMNMLFPTTEKLFAVFF